MIRGIQTQQYTIVGIIVRAYWVGHYFRVRIEGVSVFREACLGNGHYEPKPIITNIFSCEMFYVFIMTIGSRT